MKLNIRIVIRIIIPSNKIVQKSIYIFLYSTKLGWKDI